MACAICLWATKAFAQAPLPAHDDPYAYDLRLSAMPVTFQGGLSQSGIGSAVRAEVDLGRRFTFSAVGRLPWLALAGQTDTHGFELRAGIAWNFVDQVEVERLGGSVYPEDPPAIAEHVGPEFETPVSQRLAGPRMTLPDVERDAKAQLRTVQSLRLGYMRVRAVERARPDPAIGTHTYLANNLHVLYAGYSWGTHWNVSPATAGKREVGWRRYVFDALITAEGLATAHPVAASVATQPPAFLALGGRIGMEGSIDALVRAAPGLGFAYSIELGMLPGKSGLEGYLFAGFGVEFDLMLHAARE